MGIRRADRAAVVGIRDNRAAVADIRDTLRAGTVLAELDRLLQFGKGYYM